MKKLIILSISLLAVLPTTWAESCIKEITNDTLRKDVLRSVATNKANEAKCQEYFLSGNHEYTPEIQNALSNQPKYTLILKNECQNLVQKEYFHDLEYFLTYHDAVRKTRRDLGNTVASSVKELIKFAHEDSSNNEKTFIASLFDKLKFSHALKTEGLTDATQLHEAMICLLKKSLDLIKHDRDAQAIALKRVIKKDIRKTTLQKYGAKAGLGFLKALNNTTKSGFEGAREVVKAGTAFSRESLLGKTCSSLIDFSFIQDKIHRLVEDFTYSYDYAEHSNPEFNWEAWYTKQQEQRNLLTNAMDSLFDDSQEPSSEL